MKDLLRKILKKIRFIYSFYKSLMLGNINRKRFSNIKTFVLFIGYPRSGHSLIAALLDAHPNVVMGMEWGVLTHVKMGYGKLQIFYSIQRNSELFKKREKNVWTGYSYKVDKLWQGKFETIQIIGDKLGGMTSVIIMKYPELLQKLEGVIKIPVKFIHVIRNPFDTITTITTRMWEKNKKSGTPGSIDLLPIIYGYFKRADTVQLLKKNSNTLMFDLYHEDFIAEPHKVLLDLLKFLDVQIFDDYLFRCTEIVFKEPQKSRYTVHWSEDLIKFVQDHTDQYEFLRRYKFDS